MKPHQMLVLAIWAVLGWGVLGWYLDVVLDVPYVNPLTWLILPALLGVSIWAWGMQ